MFNAERFYAYTRAQPARGPWTEAEVDGCERILNFALHRYPWKGSGTRVTPTNVLAYILATAHWEAHFQPVAEAWYVYPNSFEKAEAWRKRNLRYYPWYGRGLVQTTWERNYRALGGLLADTLDTTSQTFIDHPEKLLEWNYALWALFRALEVGLYTGKKLEDYIDDLDESDAEDRREYINTRRTVNGTDRAERIADLAIVYEHGLREAGYSEARDVEPDAPGYTPPKDDSAGAAKPASGKQGGSEAPTPTEPDGPSEGVSVPAEVLPCWVHFAKGFACMAASLKRKD